LPQSAAEFLGNVFCLYEDFAIAHKLILSTKGGITNRQIAHVTTKATIIAAPTKKDEKGVRLASSLEVYKSCHILSKIGRG
jgi:hypothetical protein